MGCTGSKIWCPCIKSKKCSNVKEMMETSLDISGSSENFGEEAGLETTSELSQKLPRDIVMMDKLIDLEYLVRGLELESETLRKTIKEQGYKILEIAQELKDTRVVLEEEINSWQIIERGIYDHLFSY